MAGVGVGITPVLVPYRGAKVNWAARESDKVGILFGFPDSAHSGKFEVADRQSFGLERQVTEGQTKLCPSRLLLSVVRFGLVVGDPIESRSERFNACRLTAPPQILSARELLR